MILRAYLILFLFLLTTPAFSQVARFEYGKNRVQYHDDFDQWLLYESANFVTYWYGKARNQGIATMKLAEQDHNDIIDIIEHRINDKIELIVYSDISDYRQSNIGLEEAFEYEPERTKVVGNKVFIYFDGDRTQLRKQIRSGVAEVYINNMFYGSNLQEVVQNAVSAELPEWFKLGLIKYIGYNWTVEDDANLRSIFLNEKKTKFKKLVKREQILMGQSFWYYIAIRYGSSEISNLLYLSRINRNLDDAFLYVFGEPLKEILIKWEDFFNARYLNEINKFEAISENNRLALKLNKKIPIVSTKFSPDGLQLAVIDNRIGKSRVFVKDLATGEQTKVFRTGFRNNFQAPDYDYPQICWNETSTGLFVVYEKRDVLYLEFLDLQSGNNLKQIIPERYERIYSVDYISDNELIFTALSNGSVDIYSYAPNTRQSTQLTEDIFDDYEAFHFTLAGQDGIIFRSNRPNDTLLFTNLDTLAPFGRHNLFFLNLTTEKPTIKQLTYQQNFDYERIEPIEENTLAVLTDQLGIRNIKAIHIDPNLMAADQEYMISNYQSNILEYDINPLTQDIVRVHFWDREYHAYLAESGIQPIGQSSSTENFQYQSRLKKQNKTAVPKLDEIPTNQNEELINIAEESEQGKNYLFQTRFSDMPEEKQEIYNVEQSEPPTILIPDQQTVSFENVNDQLFDRLKIIPYRLKFRIHSLTTDLNNDLLFGGLNSYAGFQEEYEQQPVGILAKAVIKDIFEDYSFEVGVRIPTSFNGSEYFVVFNDDKNRIDKQYAFYRKSQFETTSEPSSTFNNRTTNIITLGQLRLKYPLDIYQSLQATATVRQDRFVFNSSNPTTLDAPDLETKRVGLKLEYIYDNAIDIDLNLRHGTRFKIYAESIKKFDLSLDPWKFDFGKGFMTVLGVDARQYINFARHSVFAIRFAAATSFGSERILNYLGGTDNWITPKFNQTLGEPQGIEYAYRSIAPNLRGFEYNIRNGSKVALINTELRLPLFKYLNPRIRFGFLRHFQAIAFFDAGLAWEGTSPFDENNPINIATVSNPPTVNVQVNYYKDPLVMGYGIGFRTLLFGYFIRVDYAWGVETRIVQDPKLHISLGLDF